MHLSLKLLGKLFAASILVLIGKPAIAANPNGANYDCVSSINPAALITAQGGNRGECDATPDSMSVKFYKLGLCTSKPAYNDYSACTFLFENAQGKEVTLSKTSTDYLVDGEISIPEGSYKYAMLVIEKTIGIKKTLNFDNNISAMNGTTGKYCRTNGNPKIQAPTAHNQSLWSCTNDASSQAVTSRQSFNGFFNDNFDSNAAIGPGNMPFVVGLYDQVTSAASKFDVILMASEGTLASVGVALNNYGSPYPTGDATKIWGVQTFTNPIAIDAYTSIVDLGFAIDDGMMAGFGGYCANGGKCIESATVTKFEFQVTTK
jgi:hypothetical protein